MTDEQSFRVDLGSCARCGQDHDDLRFDPLSQAHDDDEWSHWASCPETDEPVLLMIMEEDVHDPLDESSGSEGEREIVNVKCRRRDPDKQLASCGNMQAYVEDLPGSSQRYECTECGATWTLG